MSESKYPEHDRLSAEADALIQSWDQRGSWTPDSPIGMIMQLRDALAAQPVLDPEKVAEVLRGHILGDPYGGTASGAACDCSCGAESYSGDGSRSHARNLAQKHQARALCEAAKRGELS